MFGARHAWNGRLSPQIATVSRVEATLERRIVSASKQRLKFGVFVYARRRRFEHRASVHLLGERFHSARSGWRTTRRSGCIAFASRGVDEVSPFFTELACMAMFTTPAPRRWPEISKLACGAGRSLEEHVVRAEAGERVAVT